MNEPAPTGGATPPAAATPPVGAANPTAPAAPATPAASATPDPAATDAAVQAALVKQKADIDAYLADEQRKAEVAAMTEADRVKAEAAAATAAAQAETRAAQQLVADTHGLAALIAAGCPTAVAADLVPLLTMAAGDTPEIAASKAAPVKAKFPQIFTGPITATPAPAGVPPTTPVPPGSTPAVDDPWAAGKARARKLHPSTSQTA